MTRLRTGDHYRQHVYEHPRSDDLQSAKVHLRIATDRADLSILTLSSSEIKEDSTSLIIRASLGLERFLSDPVWSEALANSYLTHLEDLVHLSDHRNDPRSQAWILISATRHNP
ncbi:hypothetical protein SISSUDRAFT_754253 [Sistotremastrum suecicum HHB10207 ss-3]|uniref:Uncharacterized protein n=1 Tax=Sistotremastrum suecicum HHB10207 ss-3 TaxID=1314776 RepID=A0A166DER6_9AGAM|nr:hypothetical protein SISSUDRAFT_754253 [Sistotremastrum suecicum HHB10207 ss-3]